MPSEEQIVEDLISKTQEGVLQWSATNIGGAPIWRLICGNRVYDVPNFEQANELGASSQDYDVAEITVRIGGDDPITLGTLEHAIRLSKLIGEGPP